MKVVQTTEIMETTRAKPRRRRAAVVVCPVTVTKAMKVMKTMRTDAGMKVVLLPPAVRRPIGRR